MVTKFLVSKLVGYLMAILILGMIFLAGWLLKLVDKDHGRWQSFTMFLPAAVLLLWAVCLTRSGHRAFKTYMTGGLFFAFGVVVLIMG